MSGKQRWRWGYACGCMVKVLPLVEEEMLLRGLISNSLDFYQLAYNNTVSASARTHAGGGVFDTAQYSDAHLKVWRQWGCEVQRRVPPSFSYHGHGVIKGCPHISSGRSGAEWQLTEWEHGRNGLRGRGSITGPGPTGSHTPTWQQAVKERTPILMSLKSDIAAEVVAQLRKEYSAIARAVLTTDGQITNTLTSNASNKTLTLAGALSEIGKDTSLTVKQTKDIGGQVLTRDDLIVNPVDAADRMIPATAFNLLLTKANAILDALAPKEDPA